MEIADCYFDASYSSDATHYLSWNITNSTYINGVNTIQIPATPLSKFDVSNNQITGVDTGETLPAYVVITSSVTGIMNGAFADRIYAIP